MARRPFGAALGWPLAVLGWPIWLVLLVQAMPSLWHLDRRATVAVLPPGTSRLPSARLLGVVLVVTAPFGIATGQWPPTLCLDFTVLGAFLLVYAGIYPGRLRTGPRANHPSPPVIIGLVASVQRGSGILQATRRHVEQNYPGEPVELVARDAVLAETYRDLGNLNEVTAGYGRMAGLVRSPGG